MVQALKKKLKSEKGFTLIELLAVIIILGILAAIAIPSITHIVQQSKEKSVQAEAVQVVNAAKMYVSDNDVTADIILSNDSKVTAAGGNLSKYLDAKGTYTITLNYDGTSKTVSYESITVSIDGITKTFADEAHVNSNTPN